VAQVSFNLKEAINTSVFAESSDHAHKRLSYIGGGTSGLLD
jgi:N-acetylmuramic acid 6-phosphate (MurNAc-6-P) etherase